MAQLEKQKQIGFIDLGAANGVKFVQRRLNMGDVRTPGLIRKVKQKAISQGIVIIDAPPGTSCPVIEAVKGVDLCLLVTEPMLFGLNDLKLAVEMVKELKLPFAAVINRNDSGNDRVHNIVGGKAYMWLWNCLMIAALLRLTLRVR